MFNEGAFELVGAPELDFDQFSVRIVEAQLPELLQVQPRPIHPRPQLSRGASWGRPLVWMTIRLWATHQDLCRVVSELKSLALSRC